jgi:tartrate/fumarate subfamily iron-sulfur-dependent hydro-lyase alpha chain
MREIDVSQIIKVIENLCIDANLHLPNDIKCAVKSCYEAEDGAVAKGVLGNIIKNFEIAECDNIPVCQDTGMACVFMEIGQDVHITGGDLTDAVNEGVRRGYVNGFLRKSVVIDPVLRGNTGDNTTGDNTTTDNSGTTNNGGDAGVSQNTADTTTAAAGEEKKGCGSALNSTYAVLALISVLGFAFVAKKREEN